jgi:hypothetical protein
MGSNIRIQDGLSVRKLRPVDETMTLLFARTMNVCRDPQDVHGRVGVE